MQRRLIENCVVFIAMINFDVKNEPRPGRPIVEKFDEILKKIEVGRPIYFISRRRYGTKHRP